MTVLTPLAARAPERVARPARYSNLWAGGAQPAESDDSELEGAECDDVQAYEEQQLRADGWHLDEVPGSDDEDGEWLPPRKQPEPTGCLGGACTFCARIVGLSR